MSTSVEIASSDDVDVSLSRFDELQTSEESLAAPLSENDCFIDEDAASSAGIRLAELSSLTLPSLVLAPEARTRNPWIF
jgi:hypothetical protein